MSYGYVNAVEGATAQTVQLSLQAHPQGTVLHEDTPLVALVVRSSERKFLGHMELSPINAQILGEELRKAAEAAQTTLEES